MPGQAIVLELVAELLVPAARLVAPLQEQIAVLELAPAPAPVQLPDLEVGRSLGLALGRQKGVALVLGLWKPAVELL